ncbi:MAG: rhomboid family intramembrane serine protease [Planctomycetota bacterium]|nr:rhomboid family intramembrane serine protease [Planctomycetota bacterium]
MSEDLGVTDSNPDSETESPAAMMWLPPSMIATRMIVIANVAIFGVMVARGVSFMNPGGMTLLDWGANFGPSTMNGQWWRLFTCMWLHFGIIHIAANMWVLWGLAQLVERLVGSVGFTVAYIVSGLAGSIASLAWNSVGISAGASGAVFGTAGALLGFVVLRRDTIPEAMRWGMLKSMGTFLTLNLVIGMSVPQIDMAAHVGGFVGGVVCGLILSQPLSPGILTRRKFRNLITVMAAAVILPLAIVALPEAPPDLNAEMQRLSEVENQIYDKFNVLRELAASGAISNIEFADRVNLYVLPACVKLREEVESFRTLKYADLDFMKRLVRNLRTREESWRLLVQGLQEQDQGKIQRANELSAERENDLQDGLKSRSGNKP